MALDEAVRQAVAKERNELMPKFAAVERDHTRRLADAQKKFELKEVDQKKKHDEHINTMLQEAVKAETCWQAELEKMADQIEDVQEELTTERVRNTMVCQLERTVSDLRLRLATAQRIKSEEMGVLEDENEDLQDEMAMHQVRSAVVEKLMHQKKELEQDLSLQKSKVADMGRLMNINLESLAGDKEHLLKVGTEKQLEIERLMREKKDLADQLAVLAHKENVVSENAVEGGETAEPTVTAVQHDKLIQFERLRVHEANENRVEMVRVIEAEKDKVKLLEARLASSAAESEAVKRLAAEKKRADAAEKSVKDQAKRAADAEITTKEMRRQLEGRIIAAGAQLGDVYRSWEETHKETKTLNARLTKTDRLRQEAVLKAEDASKAEKRAWAEVAALQGKIEAGSVAADLDELVKSLAEAEQTLQLESAARREAESKVARLEIEIHANKIRISQLRTSLTDVEGKNMEMSRIMRSGPFMFGSYL